MAVPRVFLSSTCYDLQELRFQLRRFIEDIGYEPVMSEFGDIFYDLDQHAQDACKEEIGKSNMFVLIVGNNYGSLYHRHSDGTTLPDSVTLQEFRKAIEIGIPKYIFINRFVQHDFENYRRASAKHVQKYFAANKVQDDQIQSVKGNLKQEFDSTYPFPQDAYRYIFYFLEIIHGLDLNNAVFPFESFEDVRDTLRKQWAGFVHDALTKERTVAMEQVEALALKLDKIEYQMRLIADIKGTTPGDNKVTIDITKLGR